MAHFGLCRAANAQAIDATCTPIANSSPENSMKKPIIAILFALASGVTTASPFGEPVVLKPRVQPGGAPATPSPRAKPDAPQEYELNSTQLLNEQLNEWAERGGWTFRWYADVSWRVIAPSQYGNDFEKAFLEVMDILINEEGKPLRFTVSKGNRVVEVYANDLR